MKQRLAEVPVASPTPTTTDRVPMPAAAGRAGSWIDGVWIAAIFGALYVLLGQDTLYRIDAHQLLWHSYLELDYSFRKYHTFYLPLLWALKTAAAPFGMSLYETARAMSALGMVVGILLVHAANVRLGLSRLRAALATALVAASPPVVFFATVVEVHGPFVAFAGLSWLAIAHLVRAPNALRAVLLGASLWLTFLAHPTGALEGAVLVPVWLLARAVAPQRAAELSARRLLGLGALAFLVLLSGVLAVPLVLARMGVGPDVGWALEFLLETPEKLLELPLFVEVLWEEWAHAFLPLSAVVVLLVAAPRWRAAALGVVVALLPYLWICQLMLHAYEPELGAYLIPLAWPMAALTACALTRGRLLGPVTVVVMLVASVAIGVQRVVAHDDPTPARALAAGIEETTDGDDYLLLISTPLDLEAFFVFLPRAEVLSVPDLIQVDDAVLAATLPKFDEEIARKRALGYRVLIGDATKSLIDQADELGLLPGRRFLRHLESHYRLERVGAVGFSGYEILER